MPRFWEIDFFRGVAICMMVLFHFLWDLNYFGFLQGDIYSGFWGLFQKATMSLFLLVAGVVLAISRQNNPAAYTTKSLGRGATVFSLGLLITAFTLIFFPGQFIYFGILHLIGASIVLSVPFAGMKKINALLGASIIAIPALYDIRSIGQPMLVWLGFAQPMQTLDFSPVFPWFGVVLIGIALGNFFYEKGGRRVALPEPKNSAAGFLQLLGKHSLLIYFTHQIILYPLVSGLNFLA